MSYYWKDIKITEEQPRTNPNPTYQEKHIFNLKEAQQFCRQTFNRHMNWEKNFKLISVGQFEKNTPYRLKYIILNLKTNQYVENNIR